MTACLHVWTVNVGHGHALSVLCAAELPPLATVKARLSGCIRW